MLKILENWVTTENANEIKIGYVIEIVNGPVDYDTDPILFEREIMVVFNTLINTGGLVVSYFK